MQLHKTTSYRLKKNPRASKPAEELKPKKPRPAENEENKAILPKEFIWDRVVFVLVAGILSLTVADLIAEFFSQSTSTVVCRTPSSFSAVQSSFVNSFCFTSLSSAQYYPLFLTIHGLLIIVPQQIWSWLFSGHIDFFFDMAKALGRLKDPSTGEYDPKSFAIVTKLEIEFAENHSVYRCYVGKLFLQLVATTLSLFVSWIVFNDFSTTFLCFNHASAWYGVGNNSISDTWPVSFECTYIPFRLFSILRYIDTILIIAVIFVLIYGVIWCAKKHSAELGANETAMFAFTSCLPPEKYVFPKQWPSAGTCQWRCLFSPSIKSDLDFLVLRLYQSDSGHGKVFKELQVSKAYRSLHIHDHKLLHLLINLQQDWRVYRDAMRNSSLSQRCNNKMLCNSTELEGEIPTNEEYEHHLELQDYFRKYGGKYANPEVEAYKDYKEDLGNINLNGLEWIAIQTIRSTFYEFVKCAPHLTTTNGSGYALDVSFGTLGYTLALARAFQKVRSVNFHPFYEDDMPKRTAFYTNYDCIMVAQDVFSRSSIVLNKTNEYICEGIRNRNILNFIVVGPIDDTSKIATVNLLISHLLSADCIETNAMLLTVRPLQIAHKSTSETYFSYEPSEPKFAVERENLRRDYAVNCAGTQCVFEFKMYRFLGGSAKDATDQNDICDDACAP